MSRDLHKNDMIGAIVAIVMFGVGYIFTNSLQEGAKMWPQFICGVGIVLSIIQFIGAYRKYKALPAKEPATAEQKTATKKKYIRALAVVVIVAVWLFLMDIVGFIVTSSIAMIALMVVPERPKNTKVWIFYIVLSVVFCIILWFAFGLLGAKLPRGFLI